MAIKATIYAEWKGGKRIKTISHEREVSESTIKRWLMEYRIDHNLPNGRKHAQSI